MSCHRDQLPAALRTLTYRGRADSRTRRTAASFSRPGRRRFLKVTIAPPDRRVENCAAEIPDRFSVARTLILKVRAAGRARRATRSTAPPLGLPTAIAR